MKENTKEHCQIVDNRIILQKSGRELLKKFGITSEVLRSRGLVHSRRNSVAWEPIVLAQKPREGSYIENIRKWKVGALNIDECRIPYASDEDKKSLKSFINFADSDHGDAKYFSANEGSKKQVNIHPGGRWPSNLLYLDPLFADYDRIFMVPKPSKSERRRYNKHETVKPIRLMERLIRLVTPRSSVVGEKVVILDPFMGSCSTGRACRSLKRNFIGFEINEDSFATAKKRLKENVRQDIGEI